MSVEYYMLSHGHFNIEYHSLVKANKIQDNASDIWKNIHLPWDGDENVNETFNKFPSDVDLSEKQAKI